MMTGEEILQDKTYITVIATWASELETKINKLAERGYIVDKLAIGSLENKQKYMCIMKKKED